MSAKILRLATASALTAVFSVSIAGPAFASEDSAIVGRWVHKRELRNNMLATAQSKERYWDIEGRGAKEGSPRMWETRQRESDARKLRIHRTSQVNYAQRVINRHSPKPKPARASTPAGGGGGGGWSIPTAIVMCESGGSWTAQNPSGARGPYQLMPGTYAAYGGDGSWSHADQHAVAARLYAAEGTAPWNSSRSCWGGRV